MNTPTSRVHLAQEPDFVLGGLTVSPSACRVVAGQQETRVEAQTMAVLVVLGRAEGATVTRDALVETCWQGRIVSDDAITRTIAKVRALARGMDPAPFTLETLPKVGYRLLAREVAAGGPAAANGTLVAASPAGDRKRSWRPLILAAGVAIAIPVAWAVLPRNTPAITEAGSAATDLPTAAQVSEALLMLDLNRVQDYLDRGWDVDWKLDAEGSNAMQTLFMACERNPSHNKGAVVQIARVLVLADTDLATRNKWDDSALDIAISPRYCGPHHPVVDYLKSMSPAEVTRAAMERACGEAFEGKKTSANWASTNLTREECEVALE